MDPATQGSELRVDLKNKALDRLMGMGGALIPGAGVAIVLAVFRLLGEQPREGFDLLQKWGWWWLVVLVGMYFIWDLAKRAVAFFGELVRAVQQSAAAMTKIADKDDRQAEELRRMNIYTAREIPRMHDRFDSQDVVLSDLAGSVKSLHLRLDKNGVSGGGA